MPTDVTYMSWNILHYGPSKIYGPNFQALVNIIAEAALDEGVSILTILETAGSSFDIGGFVLRDQLNLLHPTNTWDWTSIATNIGEHYLVLWDSNVVQAVPIPVVRPSLYHPAEVERGLVTQDVHGNTLQFHSTTSRRGGIQPGYVLFRTNTAPNPFFSIITYHAAFGTNPGYRTVGLNSIAQAAEIQTVTRHGGAATTNVAAALVSGDFNLNLLTWHTHYLAAMALGHSAVDVTIGNQAKSTMKTRTPAGGAGYPSTVDYRANAYDNIFVSGAPTQNGHIVDILDEMGAWAGASGNLSNASADFDLNHLDNGAAITSNPPTVRDDAWHIYFTGVSNHLPVVITATI